MLYHWLAGRQCIVTCIYHEFDSACHRGCLTGSDNPECYARLVDKFDWDQAVNARGQWATVMHRIMMSTQALDIKLAVLR